MLRLLSSSAIFSRVKEFELLCCLLFLFSAFSFLAQTTSLTQRCPALLCTAASGISTIKSFFVPLHVVMSHHSTASVTVDDALCAVLLPYHKSWMWWRSPLLSLSLTILCSPSWPVICSRVHTTCTNTPFLQLWNIVHRSISENLTLADFLHISPLNQGYN